MSPRANTFEPGMLCAKFRIEKILGRGGMGEVYLAVDTFLGRRVALKVLPFRRALDPSFRDRMQREATAGARIEHPNVTRILDGGATENHVFYIVMELLEDMRTLRALCHKTLLPLDSSLIVAIQIAEGLSAVHAAGIVHRDLKPENVAILPGGVTKIIDFGLAKVRSEYIRTSFDPTRPEERMGTAHYMAPEQIDNRKDDIGSHSDVYALGCILFELFSAGRHVFQGTGGDFPEQMAAVFAHVARVPPRLDSPDVDTERRIPKSLADLVARCLAKDFRERPDAADVGRALRKILEEVKGRPVASSAPTPRVQVPTDTLGSQRSVPQFELPTEVGLSERTAVELEKPGSVAPQAVVTPQAIVTPHAWELRRSPPAGFAPVLVTEALFPEGRATLESPKPFVAAPNVVSTTLPIAGAAVVRALPAATPAASIWTQARLGSAPPEASAPGASAPAASAPVAAAPRLAEAPAALVVARSESMAFAAFEARSKALRARLDAVMEGFAEVNRSEARRGVLGVWFEQRVSLALGAVLPFAILGFAFGLVALLGVFGVRLPTIGQPVAAASAPALASSEPQAAQPATATARPMTSVSAPVSAAPSNQAPPASKPGPKGTWPPGGRPGQAPAPSAGFEPIFDFQRFGK